MKKLLFLILLPVVGYNQNILWTNEFDNASDWVIDNSCSYTGYNIVGGYDYVNQSTINAPSACTSPGTIAIDPNTGNTAQWRFETDPNIIPVAAQSPFVSSSVSNGFLFIDSDACGGGDGDGTPIYVSATIVTPIDLSAENNVILSFSHNYKWWKDTRGVRVSGDNGTTWHQYEITNNSGYSNGQSSGNPEITSIDISSVAGGQSQVLIQFFYEDNDFWAWYWAIDDVRISRGASIVGSWSLNPAAGALAVGPDSASTAWWSSSVGDVNTRYCLFDDSIVFSSNGTFEHYMDGSTWLESWQSGSPAEGCGVPISPHDGGSNAYTFTNGTLTVNGPGAHLGFARVHNSGEDGAPVNDQITYSITFSGASNEIMTVDISFPNPGGTNGLGWWRYVYLRNGSPPPPQPPSYTVTFNVHTDLIAGNVSSDGIYIGGGFIGDYNALLLDDSDGDGVWSGSTILDAAGGHFTILNGNCSDWSCKEDIYGQSCADANNFNDRNNLLGNN